MPRTGRCSTLVAATKRARANGRSLLTGVRLLPGEVRMVSSWMAVMVVQLCEYTKVHSLLHFERVNFKTSRFFLMLNFCMCQALGIPW